MNEKTLDPWYRANSETATESRSVHLTEWQRASGARSAAVALVVRDGDTCVAHTDGIVFLRWQLAGAQGARPEAPAPRRFASVSEAKAFIDAELVADGWVLL